MISWISCRPLIIFDAPMPEPKTLSSFFEDTVNNVWRSSPRVGARAEAVGWKSLSVDEKFTQFKKQMEIHPHETLDSLKEHVAAQDLSSDALLFPSKKFGGSSTITPAQRFLISQIPPEKLTSQQAKWLQAFPEDMFKSWPQKATWSFRDFTETQKKLIVDDFLATGQKSSAQFKSSPLAANPSRWIVQLPADEQRWLLNKPMQELNRREIEYVVNYFSSSTPPSAGLNPAQKWIKDFFQVSSQKAGTLDSAEMFDAFLAKFFQQGNKKPLTSIQKDFLLHYYHDEPTELPFKDLAIQLAIEKTGPKSPLFPRVKGARFIV